MARPSTVARRYAEAAFELALRDGALDAWRDGLATAAAIVGHDRVQQVVDNPALPLARRRAMLERLLDGRVPPGVLNLVRLLAARGRIDRLGAVSEQFGHLLNRHRGIVEAVVTSAVPLDTAETDAIRARVEAMTGRSVDLTSRVDGELIGGLTVRVGDTLLDASVRGRLERLRDQLVTGSR
jgi:F-type H+-transporting ATPase subunit delta